MYFKFIGVVEYDEDGIWISIRLKNLMKGSFQVIFEKSDGEESQTTVRKEIGEKTGLLLP